MSAIMATMDGRGNRLGSPMGCHARVLPALTADADSPFWQSLTPHPFLELIGGARPAQDTSIRAAWDAEELRLLFVAEDLRPWSTIRERKGPLYTEEVVEVFLDPVGDLASYFELEVNSCNALLDLVLRRNRSGYVKDVAWECEGFQSVVSIKPGLWSTELSIPFASVTSNPPSIGSLWRMNFCRIDRPEGVPRELSAWAPTFRSTFHTPERFGVVEFV